MTCSVLVESITLGNAGKTPCAKHHILSVEQHRRCSGRVSCCGWEVWGELWKSMQHLLHCRDQVGEQQTQGHAPLRRSLYRAAEQEQAVNEGMFARNKFVNIVFILCICFCDTGEHTQAVHMLGKSMISGYWAISIAQK